MHKHFVEEPNIEHFLKCFLPGSDPTAADFETFYYPPRVITEDLKQQDVNSEIVGGLNPIEVQRADDGARLSAN